MGTDLIGNDLYSVYDADYDTSIPQRTQDLAQAKSLLKTAGRSDLTVQLQSSDIAAGVTEMAQVFAQQARGAGVTVNIATITPTDMFGPSYLKWTFAFDSWPALGFLTNTGEGEVPGAPYNETHFNNSQLQQALRTGPRHARTGKAEGNRAGDAGHLVERGWLYHPVLHAVHRRAR